VVGGEGLSRRRGDRGQLLHQRSGLRWRTGAGRRSRGGHRGAAGVGERGRILGATFRSAGGPGHGVQIVVWGPAITEGIVEGVEIVQGLVEDAIRLDAPQPGLTRRRLLDMQTATWISVVLDGIALAPGEGDPYLGITPLENPAGQTSWTFEVEISRN